MKDLTPTSFGLLIAFLLPGLQAFYGLSFWSSTVADWMERVQDAGVNLDHLSLVLLFSLILGLELTIVRWLVFERLLCRHHRFGEDDFQFLSDEHTLGAFRAAAEEYYRYHQFWGGTALALPISYVGWLKTAYSDLGCSVVLFSAAGFLAVEVVTGLAAVEAFKRYVSRGRTIAGRSKDAQRMGKENKQGKAN